MDVEEAKEKFLYFVTPSVVINQSVNRLIDMKN